jgi:long-chain acyl-CoA synthetase
LYPGEHAITRAQRPALIIAETGESVTYAELEARSNRLAHLLRANSLRRLDHFAIFMENNAYYLESCAAGERAGMYYTCVNSHLTPDEVTYILNNSESKALITSEAKRDVAVAALRNCPNVDLCLIVNGNGDGRRIQNLREASARFPVTPVVDEALGRPMLYSSGTTGQPKGVLRALPEQPPLQPTPYFAFLKQLWQYHEEVVYLSPAPLYHAAPQLGVGLTIRAGGTAVIMERFDAERFLELVEHYEVTHSHLVPTMFSRMLKLPEATRHRYDVSSLEVVIHGAAPCPVPVKQRMIEWWGPIIHEYYGATESFGLAACNSAEWLAHKGTVGRMVYGCVQIIDEEMNSCPTGTPGTLWFRSATPFEYFNDPEKTDKAHSSDRSLCTVGDVGYLDQDGYLYLTDRATFMIISGGVNIYPQECENLLITHPKVMDAAVFGVPNDDLGEEVKAVVQLAPGITPGQEIADELIAFCTEHLARQKCPRTIDFEAELPRLPTGKLYKRILRDRYWAARSSRIV